MLRRLLFFIFVFYYSFGSFAQSFELSATQSLNSSKDSLLISVFVRSTTVAQELGSASIAISADSSKLELTSIDFDSINTAFNNAPSYKSLDVGVGSDSTFIVLSVRPEFLPPSAPGNNVFTTPTFIARIKLFIKDKCVNSDIGWNDFPANSVVGIYSGPFDPDPDTTNLFSQAFLMRDSIGGSVQITAMSDTICQGSDIDIAFALAGENDLNIRFSNGTDSYLASNLGLSDPAILYTPTITGEAIYTIDSIQDVNGCWESTSLNFVDDTAFIDVTVPLSDAGTNDSICLEPKTYTLNGNDPTIAFNGVWTANSTGAVFVDNSQFSTDVTVDTGGYYYFTWTISSLIDGATGACPSEEDSVRIRFFRQPSPAIIDSTVYNLCAGSLPATIANIAANPLDTGVGTWTIISAPGGAIGPFFSDPNNDTTDFTSNVQGTYDVKWKITNGICPADSDNVLINFELPAQDPVINTLDGTQCGDIANLDAQNIPLVGNLEFWSTTSSAVIAGTTNPITTATLPTYTFDSTFTFYWNSQNTTVPGVCPTKQDSVKITRLAQPDTTASLNLNNTAPACGGTETYTIANVVAGSRYNWILPAGFTITNSNFPDSTFIDVTLDDPSFSGNIIIIENTVGNCSGGVDTLFVVPVGCQFDVQINNLNSDTICIGDTATLFANTPSQILGSTLFQWDSTETGLFTTFQPLTIDGDTVSVVFNDPGNWQVRVTASEPTIPPNPAVAFDTIDIVVVSPPIATFSTSSVSPICKGDTLKFVVDITGGAPPFTLEIDTLGGGLPITINNYTSGDTIRIVPTQGTSYLLSSVSDNFSCSGGSITGGAFPFVVNALPTLSITTPAFPDICLGDSISIGFSAPGALPYNNVYINSAGGQEIVTITSDPENLFFTPTADGLSVYSIDSVEDSNGCVSTSAPNISGTATVTVNDGIDSAQFTGADIICIGENDTLTIEAFGGAGPYDYFLTNTTTLIYNNEASPFNFIESPLANTTYTLDSIIDNFGCVVSPFISQTTTVNPLPTATISGAAWICEGDMTPLTFTSSGTDTIYYSANGVNQDSVIGPGPIVVNVSPTVTTNYTIDSVISASGCTVNDPNANITGNPVQVFVNPAITSANLLGGDTICEGETDNIYANIVGGTGQFSLSLDTVTGGPWTLADYNSGDSIAINTFATLTTTLLSVTDDSTCTFTTPSSTTTTVNPLATATINVVAGGDTICSDGSSTADIEITLPATGGPFDVTISDGINPDTTLMGLGNNLNTIQLNPSSGNAFDSVEYVIIDVLDNNTNCLVDSSNANITGSAKFYLIQPYVGTVTASGSVDLCFGENVTLTASNTSGYSNLQWLFGGNPISGETDSVITVDYTGSFSIEVGISACIATSDSIGVLVAPPIDSVVSIILGNSSFCENDSVVISVPSVQGNALRGRLGASYVQTSYNGILGNASRTVEAWIRTDSAGGIIGYGTNGPGQGFLMRLNNATETPGNGTDGALKVAIGGGYRTGSTVLTDGMWHHVAAVFDGTNLHDIELYVDGQIETISDSTVGPVPVNTIAGIQLRIGTTNIGFSPTIVFGGLVDEVRFWDVALDQPSINNNKDRPLIGTEPGLVGLWNFEDTLGGTVKDEAGVNDGTLENGANIAFNQGFYLPGANYEWFNGASTVKNGPESFLIVKSTGDYSVDITNGSCVQTSDTVSIREVIQNPSITAGGPTNICFNENVVLTASGQTALEDSTIWHYASNSISGANTNTLTADASGSYSVVFYDNGCADTSNAILVDVAAEIDTTLTVDGDTALCDNDTTFLSVPLYGGNNLRQNAKADVIRDVGNLNDFSFIHESGRFTLQYWQKLNTPNATKISAAVGNAFDGTDPGFFAGYQRGNIAGIALNGQFKLHLDGGGAPWIFHTTGAQQITDTLWHQVTIVVDSNKAEFYLDNALLPSTIALGTPIYAAPGTPANNRVTIGDANSFPGVIDYTNRGGIDEVRIWDIMLDPATISNNWNRPLNGNEPGLVALFDLDEDTSLNAGDNVFDISPNAFSGVLNGGAQITNSTNSMPNGILSYQWNDVGTGPIAGATSNELAVTTSGDYFVVISNGSCSDTSRTVTINSYSITPQINVLSTNPTCFGDSVQLQAVNLSGVIDFVRWYYGNQLVDSINNPYYATLSGLYTAEIFNNICSDTSVAQAVDIAKAIDTSLYVFGDSVLCADDTVILSAPIYGSSSLSFNNTNEKLENIGTTNDFRFIHETASFSTEFWVKLNSSSGVQIIAGNANIAANTGFNIGAQFNGSNQGFIRLRLFNGGLANYNSSFVWDNSNFDDWNHVAVSYDNGVATFYFNGSLINQVSTAFAPVINPSTSPLVIGGTAANNGFTGKIDEFRIWKFPLTQNQISQNYQRPLNFDNDLVTVFSFDVDSSLSTGDIISDNAGLLSGTLSGVDVGTDSDNPFQPSTQLSYLWYKDGSSLGITTENLTIDTGDFVDSAEYYVEIDNLLGCGPLASRVIKIKENLISDSLFVSPTEFCFRTDSAAVTVDLNAYDSVEIYSLPSNTLLAVLDSTIDTLYVTNTDTIYGIVYNTIDGKLCTQTTVTKTIEVFVNPDLVIIRDTIIFCFDSADVLYDVTAGDSITNGSGIVNSYAWSPNYNLSDSTDLNAVYTANPDTVLPFILTITDDNGCIDSDTVVAETNPQIVVTLQSDTIICFDTELDLGLGNTITGGKAPFNFDYLWNSDSLFINAGDTNNLNAQINGDSKGVITYGLLVTDNQTGCIGLDTVIVTINDSIRFASLHASLIDTICFNTASIVIGGSPTADADSGIFEYAWFPSNNLDDSTLSNPLFTNPSVAGTYNYNVIATDNVNCADTSKTVTVEVAPEIIVSAGNDTVACYGDSSIVIGGAPTASGGFGAFVYEWTTLGGTPLANTILDSINSPNPTIQYGAVLPSTITFIVTVSDSSSTLPSKVLCNNSDTITITFNPEIIAQPGNSDFTCFGIDTLLNGTASGGSMAGYTFEWIGDISKVNDPTNPNSNFIADSSGIYNLNLIAFDNTYPQCSDTSSVFTIEVNDTIDINAGNDTILCYQQSVELGGIILPAGDTTGSGGSGTGFIYNWSGVGTTSTFFLSSTSIKNPIFNQNLSTDTIFSYAVLINDNTHPQCFERDTINITVNRQIIVDPGVNDSICFGDTLVLGGATVGDFGFGGFTYQWSSQLGNTLQNATDEKPSFISTIHGIDSVKVVVTDGRSCQDSASITIEVDSLPNISFLPFNGFDICRGEDTTIIASSTTGNQSSTDPLTYSWNNGDVGTTINVQPNNDTTYEVTVLNTVNGCTNSDTINVEVNPLPASDIKLGFAASPGAIVPDTLRTCSSPVQLRLNSDNDSSNTATSFWTLLDPPGPTTIPAGSTNDILILKTEIQPTGNTVANVTTDDEGCVFRDTVFITTNNLPNAVISLSDSIVCFGDSISIQVTGVPNSERPAFFSYARLQPTSAVIPVAASDSIASFQVGLSSPAVNPPITVTTNFVYEVSITTSSGCVIEIPKNITVNPNPNLEIVAPDTLCFDEDLILTISNLNPSPKAPLDSFIWNLTGVDTSQLLITSLYDTIINVVAYDTNGCVGMVEDTIYTKALPDVSLNTAGPLEFCDGDTAHIFVPNNPNYNYEWKDIANPPAVILPSAINLLVADTTGDYFVTVTTDGRACSDSSAVVSVTEYPLPDIQLDTLPSNSEFCFGDSVRLRELNSYPPAFYVWNEATLGTVATGTNFIYVSDSGLFKVIVTDANGCIDSSAVQEFFKIPLSTDSILGEDTVCAQSQTIYNSSSGVNGNWSLNPSSLGTIQGANNGVSSITVNWNNANSGQIFFTPVISAAVPCPVQDTFDITIVANPVASIQGPGSGCVGEDIKLFALNGGDSLYTWTIVPSFGNITNLIDTIDLALDTQVPVGLGFDTATLQLIQTATTTCTDTATVLITKYDTVNADYLAPGQDTGVCQFDIDTFTVQNIKPGVNYTFTVTSGAAVLNPFANGQVEVTWNFPLLSTTIQCIAVNGDCSDTVFHSFSVQPTPVDSFNYFIDGVLQTSPITSVCVSTDSVTYRLRTPNFNNTFSWTLQSPGGAATALGALDTTFLSVSIDAPGSYILTMIEETGNGCSITLTETVTIDPVPTFNVQIFDTVICETDAQQTYVVSGNFNFTTLGWEVSNSANMFVSNDPLNNQIIVNWGPPGIDKWVIPTYSQGLCTVTGDTIFMDVEALPNPYITPNDTTFSNGTDTIFCQNLRTFFFANPGDTTSTFRWYLDGNLIADSDTSRLRILESGTYSFSLTTQGAGCVDSTDIGVVADVLPTPDAEIRGDTLWCGGGDSTILESVNTASSYEWFEDPDIDSVFNLIPNSDVKEISVFTPGYFYVVLTNAGPNGCTDTSEVFVISPLAPAVSLFRFDSINSFCNNEIVPLNGNNGGRLLEYEWITNGQGQIVDPFTDTTTYIPSDFDSGMVSFEFIVSNFCNTDISADTADLRVSPDASYTPSSLVAELEELVTFEVNTRDAILYSWNFGNGQTGDGEFVENRYFQAGDYLSYLIAVNEYNCEDSFAVPIHVTRNQLIYVPNVFSPNATNADNQVMRVYGTNISGTGFEIAIFNRWGIKVFESTDLTEMKMNGWNGTQSGNGAKLPSGVYTYYIKGQFFNDEIFQKVGTVSLIK